MIFDRRFARPKVAAAGVGFLVLFGVWPTPASTESPEASADGDSLVDTNESTEGLVNDEEGDEVAEEKAPEETAPVLAVPDRLKEPPLASAKPLPLELDVLRASHREKGRLMLSQGEEERVLTIDLPLQDKLMGIMRDYRPPYAAVVAVEPQTGRVLAMSEFSAADPSMRGLPIKAVFPAASIFKIVTAAALLDAGVDPEAPVCSYGGKRKISARHLVDSMRDAVCYTLSRAFAKSANAIFAKMTAKFLSAPSLKQKAEALFFNKPIPFPEPMELSLASVPDELLGLANTGAGFGDVYLSPLHGALLAATIANEGVWKQPKLFEGWDSQENASSQVLSPERARQLTEMMTETINGGTARRVFRERGYQVRLAAGKTGSLADRKPFRDYSWFVGFAPVGAPRIAVAAVIVNNMVWRIRAPWLAREAMRLYLAREGDVPKAALH